MEYNDFVITMKKKKLKFKDLYGKIPNTRGGFYKSKTGLWKAMNEGTKAQENCKRIVNFLIEKMWILVNKYRNQIRRCEMEKMKELWIKILSIVGGIWLKILLFYTPVRFKRFVFENIYKFVIGSIFIVFGIIILIFLKVLL